MAQCKQTAQEFINNAFAPMVAALCSHDAEVVCEKNNLSFCELIQPFCRLTTEAPVREPGNVAHTVHNLHINVREMNIAPPNPTMARKMLNDVVANAQPQVENSRTSVLSVGDYDLQLSASTPWYEAYRDCFLQVSYPSDHEFLKHYLACIFVVSSSHADPMDQFAKLMQEQHQQQHQHTNKHPKWFCPNILHYYVLLHDVVDADETKAEALYQTMKATYGVNACHLLQINSRSLSSADTMTPDEDNMPDPWGQFLTRKTSDLNDTLDNYENVQSRMENEAFPAKLAEGTSELTPDHPVEDATEATEEPDGQQSSLVIDHPLAQDSAESSSSDAKEMEDQPEMDNRIPRDSQNNALSSQNKSARSNQHGHCLTLSDHDRLRIFVHEFIVRGLIPWAERTLRTLSEQLTSRKGIHRSFFNATKKWFGGNKPVGPAAAMQEKANVVYTTEAPEMQNRRLADLAFIFQLYEIAYQTYHSCKRDFNNDHAWLYFAGATEMACMSVFMQGNASQRQYPQHYMETAVSTYLNTCKSPQFATRATMLSTEALKSRGMYAEAAMQFIKMTSEDSDLRSALLLEQAAHCFINMKAPMVRKFAFHMILAGHRFSKAGQKKHALRSYTQALQVYKGKHWTLAEDHINFTIGRQSFNLKQLENATAAFKHLLTSESKQTPPQQAAFLREYLFVYKQLLAQSSLDGVAISPDTLPQLPLPVMDGNNTKVLLCKLVKPDIDEPRSPASGVTFESDESENAMWRKLEELVLTGSGNFPANFQPSLQCFTNRTSNSGNPIAVVDERITVEVQLGNPLKIPLALSDVILLWKFVPIDFEKMPSPENGAQPISNEVEAIKNPLADQVVETQVISDLILSASDSISIHLNLTPKQTGELHIIGLAYNLGTSSLASSAGATATTPSGQPVVTATTLSSEQNNLSNSGGQTGNQPAKPSFLSSVWVRGRVNLDVQGPRLNSSRVEKKSKMYGPDRRLDLIVAPKMPLLQVHFTGFPSQLLCGEVKHVSVEFTNTGDYALHGLQVASTNPEFFTFGSGSQLPAPGCMYQNLIAPTDSDEYITKEMDVKHVMDIPLPEGSLAPGKSVTLPLWIRGPDTAGDHKIHLLFCYKSSASNPKLRHRVLRHTVQVTANNSLGLRAIASRGLTCSHDNVSEPLNTIMVTVEAENMNQVHDPSIAELSLLQVSCASCRWHLRHLSTQRLTEMKLNCRETMLLSFKAHKCQHICTSPSCISEKSSNGSSSKEVVFTNVTFQEHPIESSLTPCSDLYFRSRGVPDFADVESLPVNLAFLQTDHRKEDKTKHFEPLEHALQAGLTLIVIWKAFVVSEAGDSHCVMGQHHLTIEALNSLVVTPPTIKAPVQQPPVKIIKDSEPDSVPLPDDLTLSQLVKVHLCYDAVVTHDFTRSRVAMVTVQLHLFNCCDADVLVEVDTTKRQERMSSSSTRAPMPTYPSLVQHSPTATFTWAGHTVSRLHLTPAQARMLTLRACFVKPGVYNLSNLHIASAPADPVDGVMVQMALQSHATNSLVTIKQTAAPSS